MIPMTGKGTGKYYAPVYRAKKSPMKLRRIRIFKRCAAVAAAVVVVAVSIAAFQISKDESSSFVRVAASEQSLADVSSYPRIVDHSSPLPEDYVPENLMSLATVPNGDNIFLRADAAEAFFAMCSAMSDDGLGIVPVRGYVSYEEQKSALSAEADRLVAEGADTAEAQKLAEAEVFAPGEDEAQLGTTIVVSVSEDSAVAFSLTEQYHWLCANACRYGYVVRYTTANQKAAGVKQTSLHLRYVGRNAAEFIADANITLEDYVAAVKADNPKAKPEN